MNNLNMNGWDVVSLVTVLFVNDAIVNQNSSPLSMQVSIDELSAQAAFGTWQITTGGSSDLIVFSIPLESVSRSISSGGKLLSNFSYTSLVAQFDSDAINQALTTWLSNNLSQFNRVFASVQLDPSVGSDTQWAFCQPSVVAYTYLQLVDGGLANSYLGLTYNTGGNTTPGSVPQISPSFIPADCQAAFMISPALFLKNFLATAASDQFDIPSQNMSIDTNLLSISLTADTAIPQPQLEVDIPHSDTSSIASDFNKAADAIKDFLTGGSSPPSITEIPYLPFLTELQISVQDSIVSTYAKTSTVVKENVLGTVTAYNTSQSWMTLAFDASNQTLSYEPNQPTVNNHTISQSQGIETAEEIVQDAGLVAAAAGTVLTDGTSLLLVGALGGLAQGGLQIAQSSFNADNQNDAPEITGLVSNISLPVTWSGSGPFAASQAGLYQGGFYLAGNLRSTS
ncbi:hypothetical protein FVEN_g6765 [Fusarium venenatum]|nr:hypothetical protein FVEN_g6765 [Fusarium venenatum]